MSPQSQDWHDDLLAQFDGYLTGAADPTGHPGDDRVWQAPGLPYDRGGLGLTLAEQLPLARRLGEWLRTDPLDRWAALDLLDSAVTPATEGVTADMLVGAVRVAVHSTPLAVPDDGAAETLTAALPGLPDPAPHAVLVRLAGLDLLALLPTAGEGRSLVTHAVLDGASHELRLDRVELDTASTVAGIDHDRWAMALARCRLRLAAYLTGLAHRALATAHQYAGDRRQFGRTIGEFQAVGHRLAALAVRLEGAHLLTRRQADQADRGGVDPLEAEQGAARALAAAAEVARSAAETCVHIHGAAGLVRGSEPARLYGHAALASRRLGRPDGPPGPRRPVLSEPVGPQPAGALRPLADPTGLDRRQPRRWTTNPQPYALDDPVHRLVQRQAAATPDAPAVVFGDHEMSYRQLDEDAERLATVLTGRGVGRGALVGICLSRSPDLVVAVLAVLKAGAAYLPLDPDYPADRLALMCADAAPSLVLVHDWAVGLVPDNVPLLVVDNLPAEGAAGPQAVVGPDGLAYVLYTSGSTGTPKGVLVEHRGVTNRIAWDGRRFPLGPGHTVLLHTSLNFDISVWEIFAPLAGGARLAVAPPAAGNDPARLLDLVQQHSVTVLALVPSLLEMLLEDPAGLSSCPSLRWIFCGGEALPLALCRRARQQADIEIHNFYGPTEATVDATHWACDPADPAAVAPIGRPIGNAEVYLLDEHLQPVPAGFDGELYLGGPGVSPGYLRRPELTAERFRPNPYGPSPRLYRTGDLARFRPDGTLEFLGRVDDQVKIRGHRIELGEIEAVLDHHPELRRAVVVPVAGNTALHAFAVPAQGTRPDPERLRQHLAEQLPPSMVPNGVTLVDDLPTVASGKIDRVALANRYHDQAAHPPPADSSTVTAAEREAVALVATVLAGPAPGLDDDFFDAGGNSLLASRLVAAYRRRTGRPIDLAAFLAEPTPRTLARLLAAAPPDG